MLTSRFQFILGLLFVLLVPIHGKHDSKPECNVQAWVRAPDLAPNTVIQGDARVKISAECPIVESISLGLRFKERSFIKALRSREDLKWLELQPHHMRSDMRDTSPWTLKPTRFSNQTAEDAYEEIVTNKNLWIVQEEEKTVFEMTQPFQAIASKNDGSLLDAVQNFAILVPSTNFPPALDMRNIGFSVPRENEEIESIEWMYEYFALISFVNGTMKEVSAGLTTFQPLRDLAREPLVLALATVELESLRGMGGNPARNFPVPITNYSVEIRAGNGLIFSAGKKSQAITAIITRTGPAREFSAPLEVSFCLGNDLSGKWAAEYGIPDSTMKLGRMPISVLRATSYDGNPQVQYIGLRSLSCPRLGDSKVAVVMPNSTQDEIRAQEIVTTSSEPFTVSINVDDAHIFDFETSYQTLSNVLAVHFQTWQGEDELVDPDDPSAEHHFGPVYGREFEDEDEEWVPWPKKQKSKFPRRIPKPYMGRVPVVAHPAGEVAVSQDCFGANIDGSGQEILSDGRSCGRASPINYLAEGARGPVFVDPRVLNEVLAEDPAERELRAPILAPVTTSPPPGEERIYRYFHPFNPGKQPIYVGETWAKVVNKNKDAVSSKSRGFRIVQSYP